MSLQIRLENINSEIFYPLPHKVTFWRTIDNCGKHCEKGEIACNNFLTMFYTLYGTNFSFQIHLKMSSTICFNLDKSKTLLSGNRGH